MPLDPASSAGFRPLRDVSATPCYTSLDIEPLRVVGIGASAGGLAACTRLLQALPADPGMAFVLTLHLDPNHPSEVAHILARTTTLPVTEATEGETVEANHIYVNPPNALLTIIEGRLYLEPRPVTYSHPLAIDHFLSLLAGERGRRAIGIILSGTGSDGAQGLRAIKAAGGTTFAQDAASADYSEMPLSAVETGCVDFVLTPRAIAERLAKLSSQQPTDEPDRPHAAGEPSQEEGAVYETILRTLHRTVGVDFRHYKTTTFWRRVQGRLAHRSLKDLNSYLLVLDQDANEVQALYHDLLVQVTGFFRDPAADSALRNSVLPALLKDRPGDVPLRLWVAGCASGEEAYSLGISALECEEERGCIPSIQLFATDLSERALNTARAGSYPPTISARVSPERLSRFFTPVQGGYQVCRRLREICRFTRHDVTQDPPFVQMDLISCRNLLIYLDAVLQGHVLRTFHYALKPGRFLVLGPADNVGGISELFSPAEGSTRTYRRKAVSSHLELHRIRIRADAPPGLQPGSVLQAGFTPEKTMPLEQAADQLVLTEYASPAVIISDDLEIVHFRGQTSPYLAPPPGRPTQQLLKMAHPELRVSVGRAVRKARKGKVRVRLAGLSFRDGDRDKHVNIHISPLSVDDMTQHYLVIFEPVEGPRAVTRRSTGPGSRPAATDQGGDADRRIAELQEELVETRAHLQSSIDEQDGVHVELQLAHEEVLSINEELQSTNEELMTTKEELQAANEELSTLNDGLRQRNTELQTLSTDLSTLLETVDIPILMLGLDLRIRRYSPRAQAELQLRPQDIGVPINEIRGSVPLVGLEQVIERTIKEGVFQTSEIQGRQGRWYEARVWPHRTPDREIIGSVLALIDVDRIKQAMAAVASARDFSAATVETVQEPLLVLDTHLRVLSANRAFYQTFRLSPERVEQVMLTDLDAGNWNVGELVASLDEIRTKGMAFEGLEISHDFERIGPRVVRVNGRRIVQPGSNTENILLALEDVTERKFIEQRLLQAAKMQAVGQLASGVAHEVNNQAQAILGFSTFVHESLDVQDPRRSDLEQVIKAATRSGEIAQGLLAFSRQKQFHPEVLDVETVVASVETLLCRIMGPNIEVAVSVDAEVGQVEADRALLEESLVNLALNARDAMPEGGRLLVRASSIVVDDDYASHHEAGVRHGPYARIEVIDSGVGMDAATQARLFQPFFTTKPAGQGTGLGLASVYGTVTQCKGVVCVESAPGRGTTFTIDLPQVRGTMHSIPGDAPTEVAPRGSETILVVEDEEIIRSWTRRVLRQLGYTVLEAREGAEALRIIQEEGNLIQLVLSDVLMPGMDGRELGQRMTMVRPGLPLLYMSGFTEEEVARQGWLGPDQPLLAKPFGGATLASKIREMLDTQAAGLSG